MKFNRQKYPNDTKSNWMRQVVPFIQTISQEDLTKAVLRAHMSSRKEKKKI